MATYDENVANYRQTVLNGFQEVEDNLAALRILETGAAVQDEAVKACARIAGHHAESVPRRDGQLPRRGRPCRPPHWPTNAQRWRSKAGAFPPASR